MAFPLTIIRGPAWVLFGAVNIYTKGDITLQIDLPLFTVDTSEYGPVDERVIDRLCKISFVPAGEWALDIPILWPYAVAQSSLPVGSSLCGVNQTLTINAMSGGAPKSWAFGNVYISKQPDLYCTASKTAIGSVEFTGIGISADAWSVSNSVFNATGAATADPETFVDAHIITEGWSGQYTALGGATTPIDTDDDGFTVTSDVKIKQEKTNNLGTVDATFGGMKAHCSFTPAAMSDSALAGLFTGLAQGSGAVRGASLNAYSIATGQSATGTLVLTSAVTGKTITLNGCAPHAMGVNWGAEKWRAGKIDFVTTKIFTAGVPAATFALT